MGTTRARRPLVAAGVLVGLLAVGCGVDGAGVDATPVGDSSSAGRPISTHVPAPTPSPDPAAEPPRPALVMDDRGPVAADLGRLAEEFVGYAVGEADTFPHWESVSLSLGGQPVVWIDDLAAALSTRRIWRICPAGQETYGAASCPVDLLAALIDAGVNDRPLVYSAEHGDVVCATARTGPPPRGRLVVLRPAPEWRTCASDFALVLAADGDGRLRAVDLTLSEP